MNQNPDQAVGLRLYFHLPWGGLVPEEVGLSGAPAGSGAFESAGPRRLPTRPRLEASVGPEVVARVVGADGLPRSVAVRPGSTPSVVPLPAAPLSLVARSDGGLWSLDRAGLSHLAASGEKLAAVDRPGVRLVPSVDDGVWLLGLDEAALVQPDGSIGRPYPWRNPLGSIGASGALCAIDAGVAPVVRCLDARGVITSRPIPTAGPFERLLALGPAEALSSTADTLWRHGAGPARSLRVLGAGVTAQGAPFLSSADGDAALLWIGGGHVPRRIPLAPAGLAGSAPAVLTVDGDIVILRAGSRAAWYRGESVERTATVGEDTYARDLFPRAWVIDAAYPFVGEAPDRVLLSTSGPEGLAIVELTWSPGA